MNNTQTKKSVDYYLGLRYPICLRELSPEEGGGYLATIPQLGSKTFAADGETQPEALAALDELRQILIPILIEEGGVFPEPEAESEAIESHSGSLMLRIPRLLHAQLAKQAKRNGCSINKYATQLLAQRMSVEVVTEEMRLAIKAAVVEEIRHAIGSGHAETSSGYGNAWQHESLSGSEQNSKQKYLTLTKVA